MRLLKLSSLLAAVALLLFAGSPSSHAQISVQIGPAPVCPYGYYAVPPYQCAPYGYYGPTWFTNGIFIGAGPWFHGPANFHGEINNRYDVHHGYHGPLPRRGAKPNRTYQHNLQHSFRGNEERDGHGHTVNRGEQRGHSGHSH